MIDPAIRLKDFPTLTNRVYLNTAAEGIPPPTVGEALVRYFVDKQQGMDGRIAHQREEGECRQRAARLYNLSPDEIGFCSCSAEAINLLKTAVIPQPGDRFVINDIDFPSGATPWIQPDIETRLWRSRDGVLDIADLAPLLDESVRLVQTSLVSFYNGFRIDWAAFVETVRSRAPQALIIVDVTQALGRIPLAVEGADMIFSSTHKWTLGPHGGCIIGIPHKSAERITTRAGGWYHLVDAFGPQRFHERKSKRGAASFATGMPNYPAIYALNAALGYIEAVGIDRIAAHANPLVQLLANGMEAIGLKLMAPYNPANPTPILAFSHPESDRIHAALLARNIHTMNHAGRIRLAVHGYNTREDIENVLSALQQALGG